MKFYIFLILLVIQGCSSKSNYTSKHACLDIAQTLYELKETDNVEAISLHNNKGSIFYRMEGSQVKAICSLTNFNISNGEIITTAPKQEVYFLQNSKDNLINAHRSDKGFWYTTSVPKEPHKWLANFVSTET